MVDFAYPCQVNTVFLNSSMKRIFILFGKEIKTSIRENLPIPAREVAGRGGYFHRSAVVFLCFNGNFFGSGVAGCAGGRRGYEESFRV